MAQSKKFLELVREKVGVDDVNDNIVIYLLNEMQRLCDWSVNVKYNKLYGRTLITAAEEIVFNNIKLP